MPRNGNCHCLHGIDTFYNPEGFGSAHFHDTVELRSKGPGRKGNPPIREKISSPIKHFPIYFYIGYKGISVYGKNKAGPLKSLGAKFHCNGKGN